MQLISLIGIFLILYYFLYFLFKRYKNDIITIPTKFNWISEKFHFLRKLLLDELGSFFSRFGKHFFKLLIILNVCTFFFVCWLVTPPYHPYNLKFLVKPILYMTVFSGLYFTYLTFPKYDSPSLNGILQRVMLRLLSSIIFIIFCALFWFYVFAGIGMSGFV